MSDLFGSPEALQVCPVDGDVVFSRITPWTDSAPQLFDRLYNDIDWQEGFVSLFGKRYKQPRLFAWYGDDDASYAYSGTRYLPKPWSQVLATLRDELSRETGAQYNSVLANLYRDGRDGMGLHSDDEPELGPAPTIASLSFGETRTFRLRHKTRKDIAAVKLDLEPGSLLLMRGNTQTHWKHEVPKTKRSCSVRINLTFRLVHSQTGHW